MVTHSTRSFVPVRTKTRLSLLALTLLVWSSMGQAASAQEPEAVGHLSDRRLTEVSGVSIAGQPGVLWVHNDSDDGPTIYAISASGELRAVVTLTGAEANDWEDIARLEEVSRQPKPGVLYVGDIGDNACVRDHIVVYRIEEPALGDGSAVETLTVEAESLVLTYPDGAHDAETLLVEPASRRKPARLIIVTKSERPAKVYYCELPESGSHELELIQAGDLEGVTSPPTGGDVHLVGRAVILRTYLQAFEWEVADGDIVTALTSRPPTRRFDLPRQDQAECICYNREGTGCFTLSEGAGSTIYYVSIRR